MFLKQVSKNVLVYRLQICTFLLSDLQTGAFGSSRGSIPHRWLQINYWANQLGPKKLGWDITGLSFIYPIININVHANTAGCWPIECRMISVCWFEEFLPIIGKQIGEGSRTICESIKKSQNKNCEFQLLQNFDMLSVLTIK